jgi:predicted nucleic acid-binding Zn ribbon protein
MIQRKQITPKSKIDPVKQAGELLEQSQGDITKRAAALSKIAVMLADTNKEAQGLYIDEICKTHGVKKTDIRAGIRKIEKEREKAKKEEGESITKLDRYEMFLSQNFDIRYNEILMEFEITDKHDPDAQNVDEFAILRAMRKKNIEINEKTLIEILKSPYVTKYNPFRDYFNSLKTYNDSEPDYIDRLAGYLHVEDFDIFRVQFKKHLVRCVAGALEKQFNKHVLVLVGDGQYNQNSGKSTFIRWLTPPALREFYLEDLPQDKDGLIALTDNFIINLDELESLARYEINKLKSVLSKEFVKVRPPYGKRAIAIPRRASFFASTNELSFLSDLTGNVRWIVFKFKDVERPITWDYLQDFDINDIWRQAYYLFQNGYKYNLTRDEIQKNEDRNIDFLNLPPEYDLINQMYSPGTPEKAGKTYDVFYTATDFMNALHDQTRGSIKLNIIRLGKVLRKLGFKRISKRTEGNANPIKGYYVKFNNDYHPQYQNVQESKVTDVKKEPRQPVKQTEMTLRPGEEDDLPF